MRRVAPVVAVLAVAVLLTWYVVYSRGVVRELRREASRSGKMYARVFRALGEPGEENSTSALLDLARHVREMGVPLVVTDSRGTPTAVANLPFDAPLDDPRVRAYVRELDAENPPLIEQGVGIVHFGNTPLVRGLRVIPIVQAVTLGFVLLAGAYGLRTRGRADRERVWAGMARESAHQLGTPLSSLSGWLELLSERAGDPLATQALVHMRGDLERLDRVANRFERIGRPPRRDAVDVRALVDGVAAYFQARVPTLAHTIVVTATHPEEALTVDGDAVLLEWAIEALVKNAIDALAGRGGHVDISAVALPERHVRVRVADDGPGIPREMRARIFHAGFTTKSTGWGIGLSLARRIIEENHGGRLTLASSDRGAVFDVILG